MLTPNKQILLLFAAFFTAYCSAFADPTPAPVPLSSSNHVAPVVTDSSFETVDAGWLYARFPLTLTPGWRTEAFGPFWYSEQSEATHTWAVPPLLARTWDTDTDSEEFDFLYPFAGFDRFGQHYRWHIFQLLAAAGGLTQHEEFRDRFTVFPIYFQQRSSDTNENYTVVMPFYGRMHNRLFRDEINFVMLPFYLQTKKKDVITDNYFFPFYHQRHGDKLEGWQLWPFYGIERKGLSARPLAFGDTELIPGHYREFIMWPFYFNQYTGLGADNPMHEQALLPFYSTQRSPLRDSTSILWPFFNYIDEREKQYREWELPWPILVVARGPGKTSTRFWPIAGHAFSPILESDFFLWPLYKYNRVHTDPLDRRRTRIMYFLYSEAHEKNTATGAERVRTDCFPLFTYYRDFQGRTRLQILSLLEPFAPASKSIDRDWSHLWSIWRSEKNPRTGASSQSLLWNLYRRDVTPETRRTAFFFGLFQKTANADGTRVRIFYIPFGTKKHSPETAAK